MKNDKYRNIVLKGIGVSSGIGIADVFLIERGRIPIFRMNVKAEKIQEEIERFENAIKSAVEELESIKEKIPDDHIKKHAFIIEAYMMLLTDRYFMESVKETIKERRINAEWAVDMVISRFAGAFEGIKDPYLRERGQDIKYVGERLLRLLVGKGSLHSGLKALKGRFILVAKDLSPADTIEMDLKKVVGFVTDMGGRTSHTSIVARALEIPAVVGVGNVTSLVRNGERVIIDGDEGVVIINPSLKVLKDYMKKEKELRDRKKEYFRNSKLKSETKDGFKVKIGANIEFLNEMDIAVKYGASGIGLYRTEYIYLSRKELPSEMDHFYIYKKLAENRAFDYVTIRTLDIGGDKFASHIELPKEMNPAMGLRAIRLCMKEIHIFKNQLLGILRASAYGHLRILLPMVSRIEEVRRSKEIIKECMDELEEKHVDFLRDIKIGIMIEVPSACIASDKLAEEVDFFSIGTNDLIQYAFAIDRINENVSYLYEPLHPAVLRLIKETVDNAHKNKIEVGLCGEMAGDPLYVPVLLGLGIDELSMNPYSIPRIKKIIRGLDQSFCREILEIVMNKDSGKEAEHFLKKEMGRLFPDEFLRCYEE